MTTIDDNTFLTHVYNESYLLGAGVLRDALEAAFQYGRAHELSYGEDCSGSPDCHCRRSQRDTLAWVFQELVANTTLPRFNNLWYEALAHTYAAR